MRNKSQKNTKHYQYHILVTSASPSRHVELSFTAQPSGLKIRDSFYDFYDIHSPTSA